MIKIKKVLVFVFLQLLILSFLVAPLKAQLNFKVNHVATKFEKMGEKTSLFLKFNKKTKADFYQYLSEKRLAELVYVIESNKIDSVEETASRYSTYIGILTNYVLAKNVVEKKDELIVMFDRHALVVEDLQRKFEFESGWWLALQHDINSTRIFRDKLKNL